MERKPYHLLTIHLKAATLLLLSMMLYGPAFSQVLPNAGSSTRQTQTTAPKPVTKKKTPAKASGASPNQQARADSIDENEIVEPGVSKQQFRAKALEKTTELTNYIHTIIQNKTPREDAYRSIDQACLLFLDEKKDRVEVSSLNSPEKPKFLIREYLNKLQHHASLYDSIQMDYARVKYASHFLKGADGYYHATVTLQQIFKGYVDGKLVYTDETTKNVEIIAKKYSKETDSGTVAIWDVFLGDIGVRETTRVKNKK